jgi:hypothetical protein
MARPLIPGEKPDWPSSSWLVAIANLLDLFTVFLTSGYAVGHACGTVGPARISLTGIPMLVVLAIVAGYFLLFRRCLGGTIWARILRIRR